MVASSGSVVINCMSDHLLQHVHAVEMLKCNIKVTVCLNFSCKLVLKLLVSKKA